MSLIESEQINDKGYEDWIAKRAERIAARRERLGITATKEEVHIPINPQGIVEEALHANHDTLLSHSAEQISQADNFLADLDEILASS